MKEFAISFTIQIKKTDGMAILNLCAIGVRRTDLGTCVCQLICNQIPILQGCYDSMVDWIKDHSWIIIGAALGNAVFEVSSLDIFQCILKLSSDKCPFQKTTGHQN